METDTCQALLMQWNDSAKFKILLDFPTCPGLEKLWKSLESTVQVGDFVALPDNFNNLFKQAPSHLYERVHYEHLTTFLRGLQNESR